jgi:hypothetical protein
MQELKSQTDTFAFAPSEDDLKHHRMTLNMGPQHPSTHGVLRLLLELDGETILKARPISAICTPVSKRNSRPRLSAGRHADRSHRLPRPLSNNLSTALAVEKLLGRSNSAARAVDARHAGGTDAPEQPSGVARHACHRHRRDERLPLLLPRARRHSAHSSKCSPASA